ncbi:hypothetical protein MMC28_006353 [Mycoblastus sanguinarius]|nr:hypothetical protein [Mycoblastus sanguinarius]
MDSRPSASRRPIEPFMKPLLDQLQKCTTPKSSQLEDNVACQICYKPFLTVGNAEIPIKLPCGHIFGVTCVLSWLGPLPQNGPDACPLCRQPVFGDLEDEEAERHEKRFWLNQFDEWTPEGGRGVGEQIEVGAWMQRAEDLWTDFCEQLVQSIEKTEDPREWLFSELPIVRYIINLVTVELFAKERAKWQKPSEPWWIPLVTQNFSQSVPAFDRLVRHLDNLDHPIQEPLPWDNGIFIAPKEKTYARTAGYHRRIKECHAKLSYRLHEALEPDESKTSNA